MPPSLVLYIAGSLSLWRPAWPSRTSATRRADAPYSLREAALLFNQLQQDGGTPALTFMRFRMWRPFGRPHIPQHRIAQSFQFRVFDTIKLDSKLENGHGHQLRGVPVAAEGKGHLTLLKSGQDPIQSLF